MVHYALLATKLITHTIRNAFNDADEYINASLIFCSSAFIHCWDGKIDACMVITFIDVVLNIFFFWFDVQMSPLP